MASYKYDNLKVVGRHTPDYSREVGPDGNPTTVELPGEVQFGVEVDGAFVPMFSVKTSTLETMVEKAQSDQQTDTQDTGSQQQTTQ